MSDMKTIENDRDVNAFIEHIDHEQRKLDSLTLLPIMQELTGEEPRMWGDTIVGFGKYRYEYKSGRKGEFFKLGFSPRKNKMTVYIMPGFAQYESLLETLGKHKTGRSCLYINKLADINIEVLKTLITESYTYMNEKYK